MPGPAGQPTSEHDLEAIAGRVTAELLRRSHIMAPANVDDALARVARPLGVSAARVYLSDLQQRHLVPLTLEEDRDQQELPIDSTIAGRAYQTVTIQAVPGHGAGETYQVWVPVMDGTERLGVLNLTVADVSEPMLNHCRTLASLAGIMIVAKTSYSDTYAQVQRSRTMALQAELVWAFLPPRTFATEQVLVAASLEPAYEAGGDAFDYSVLGDHLHVSIFDALGHDLAAGLLASVGIASCRSTRRSGGTLEAVAGRADDAIAEFFGGDRFVTALLCDLDLAAGLFTWIPCGHPPPLLIRGHTVRELSRHARPPLGLADLHARHGQRPRDNAAPPRPSTERLEPGDQVLLYTDGVTEGRAPDGTPFGVQRLADFVIRHDSTRLPLPEKMRRLNHAILDYQHGRLRDDATVLLIQWQPDQHARSLLP